jgi:hypothetical protein
MGKYNAVPFHEHMGNPNARPSVDHSGVPAGFVPYVSWPAGETDDEATESERPEKG